MSLVKSGIVRLRMDRRPCKNERTNDTVIRFFARRGILFTLTVVSLADFAFSEMIMLELIVIIAFRHTVMKEAGEIWVSKVEGSVLFLSSRLKRLRLNYIVISFLSRRSPVRALFVIGSSACSVPLTAPHLQL